MRFPFSFSFRPLSRQVSLSLSLSLSLARARARFLVNIESKYRLAGDADSYSRDDDIVRDVGRARTREREKFPKTDLFIGRDIKMRSLAAVYMYDLYRGRGRSGAHKTIFNMDIKLFFNTQTSRRQYFTLSEEEPQLSEPKRRTGKYPSFPKNALIACQSREIDRNGSSLLAFN